MMQDDPSAQPVGGYVVEANTGDTLSFSADDVYSFDFYVMTTGNYQQMREGQPFSSLYQRAGVWSDAAKKFSYSFMAPEPNTYVFVIAKQRTDQPTNYNFTVSRTDAYRTYLLYLGIVALIIGAAIVSLNLYKRRTSQN